MAKDAGLEKLMQAWDKQHSANQYKNCVELAFLLASVFSTSTRAVECDNSSTLPLWTSQVAVHVAKEFLQRRMKFIYSHLSCGQGGRAKSALHLLTSIAKLGEDTTRELIGIFDWKFSGFQRIARPDAPEKRVSDRRGTFRPTRHFFVLWVLSLLENADIGGTIQILSCKQVLGPLLSHIGLDSSELQLQVLKYVAYLLLSQKDRMPSKVYKSVFSDSFLTQLVQITAEDTDHLGLLWKRNTTALCTPATAATFVFVDACTNTELGLLSDITCESSLIEPGTKRLLRALHLLQYDNFLNHLEILKFVLKEVPVLSVGFLASFSRSVEPRLSHSWFTTVSILGFAIRQAKLCGLPLPVTNGSVETGLGPAEGSVLRSLLRRVVPNSVSRSTLSKGLQHSSALVRFATLVLLESMLKTALHVNQCLERRIGISSSNFVPYSFQVLHSSFRHSLKERIPDPQVTVGVHQGLIQAGGCRGNGREQIELMKAQVASVLKLYTTALPTSLETSNVDPRGMLLEEAKDAQVGTTLKISFLRFLHLCSLADARKIECHSFDAKLFSTLLAVLSRQHNSRATSAVEKLCIQLLNNTGLFGAYRHLPLLCINSLVALGSNVALASCCDFFSGVLSSTLKLPAPDQRLRQNPLTGVEHNTYQILQFSQRCLSNLTKVNNSEKINIKQKGHITAFVVLLHVEFLQYSNCQSDVASLIIKELDGKECFLGKPFGTIGCSIDSLYKYLLARARWTQTMFGDKGPWPNMEEVQSISSVKKGHQSSLVYSGEENSSTHMKLHLLLICNPSEVKDVLQNYPCSSQEKVTIMKFLQGYFRLHAVGNSNKLLDTFLDHHSMLANPYEYGCTLGKRSFEQYSALSHPSYFDLSSIADIPTCITLLLTTERSDFVYSNLWENVHFKLWDIDPNDASSIIGSMGFWLELTVRRSSLSDTKKCCIIHALFDIFEYGLSCLHGDVSVHLDSLLIDGIWQRIKLQAEGGLTVYSVLFSRLSTMLQSTWFTPTEYNARSLCLRNMAQSQLLGLLGSSKLLVSQDVQAMVESLLDILSYDKSACLQQFWVWILENKASKNFYCVAVSFLSKIFLTDRLLVSFARFLDHTFLATVLEFLDKVHTQEAEKCVCSVLSWIFSSDWELTAMFWDRHLSKLYRYCTVGPFTKTKTELFVVILENFPIVPSAFAVFLNAVLESVKGDLLMYNVGELTHVFALPTVVFLRAVKPGNLSGEERHLVSLVEECLAAFLLKLNKSTHLGISTQSISCLLNVIQEAQLLLPHSMVLENFVAVMPRLAELSAKSGAFYLQQEQIWIQIGQLYQDRGKQRLGCEAHKVLYGFCKFFIVYLEGKRNDLISRKASCELCFVGVEICQQLRAKDKFVDISCHCMESLFDNFKELIRMIFQCVESCSSFLDFAKELLEILDLSSTNAETKSNLLKMSWECAVESDTFMRLIVKHDESREKVITPQAKTSSPVPLDLAPEILLQWSLSTKAENPVKVNGRKCCLVFLLTLIEKVSNTGSPWKPPPNADLFTALLSSYCATTSEEDLLLLSILQFLNSAWGGGYFERHQFQFGRHVQSSPGGNPISSQKPLLDLIDAQRVAVTMLCFPLDTCKLDARHYQSCPALSSKNIPIDRKDGTRTRGSNFAYDPSFLLQLVQHRLKRGVRIYELAKSGLVGVALAATSSKNRRTRELAYNCLSNILDSLESEDFREKTQLSLMLIHVKNSIPESFYEVPSLFSLFWANCSMVVLHPEHWMYPEINRYFLKSAVEDFKRVPLFFKMVHSGKASQSEERKWMLYLINFGLRSHEDGACLRKQFGIELVLALGMSSLCDDKTKMQVLNIVHRAAQIDGIAADLVEHSGLIPWLGQVFQQCCGLVETGFGRASSDIRHGMTVRVLDILDELTVLVSERAHRPSVFSVTCMQLLEVSNTILVSFDRRHTSDRTFPGLLSMKTVAVVRGVLIACSKEKRAMQNISHFLCPRALLQLLQIAQDDQALQLVVLIPVEAYGCSSAFTILLETIFEVVSRGSCVSDVGNLLDWLARSAPSCNTPELARGLARASLHVLRSRPQSMQTSSFIHCAIVTLLPALKMSHNNSYPQAVYDLAKTPLHSAGTSQSSRYEPLGSTLRSVVTSIDWASMREL